LNAFRKKDLDVMRLKAPGLRSLHFLANAEHPAGIHGIMGERVFFHEIP
jgi:hypothetical protein